MRVDRVRRFVEIQKQLQRAAEWQLRDLRHQEHRLHAAQQDVLEALNGDDPLHSRLAPTLARQLGRLAAKAESLVPVADQQAVVVIDRTLRLEQSERRRRAIEVAQDRASESRSLGDLIDLIAGGPRAMLR